MKIIDKRLKETADAIDRKFSKVNEENRDEISTDILSHLRNFCEVFMYKVYINNMLLIIKCGHIFLLCRTVGTVEGKGLLGGLQR